MKSEKHKQYSDSKTWLFTQIYNHHILINVYKNLQYNQ